MEIEEQRQGAVTVVRPIGALSQENAQQFTNHAQEVRSKSLGRFIIDVSAIPYIDSKGLEALVDLTELMAQSGQSLKLCGANETVREVLDLTDLGSLFESCEDANSAVRSFR